MATIGTYNEEGVNVDLYIPRKCHATNTLIASNDYSSVQIAIANVDAFGVADGTTTTFCISGFIRSQGTADHAINHLAIANGIIRIKSAKPKKVRKNLKKKGAAGKAAPKGAAPKGAAAGKKGAKPAAGKKGAAPAAKPKQGAKGAKPQAQKPAKAQAPRRK